jgi:flavin reductase (DIM6/NTAB) family NADH-FMN oxidoreductase RutF
MFYEGMTRKKPWNRIDMPVYSISSEGTNEKRNMHIITYTMAVSMQPKRFVCSIFHGTQTLENIRSNPRFVLQLLAEDQYRLVDLLGKKSGKHIDKIARLEKRNLLAKWNGFTILKESLAVMELKVINWMDAGDHCCCLCEMVAYKNLRDAKPLTLTILRKHKMIRI